MRKNDDAAQRGLLDERYMWRHRVPIRFGPAWTQPRPKRNRRKTKSCVFRHSQDEANFTRSGDKMASAD
jgi:hypothetical protein